MKIVNSEDWDQITRALLILKKVAGIDVRYSGRNEIIISGFVVGKIRKEEKEEEEKRSEK